MKFEDIVFDKFDSLRGFLETLAAISPSVGLQALDRLPAIEEAIRAAQNRRRALLELGSGYTLLLPAMFHDKPFQYAASAEGEDLHQLRADLRGQLDMRARWQATRVGSRKIDAPVGAARPAPVIVVAAGALATLQRLVGLARLQRIWLRCAAVLSACCALRRLVAAAQAPRHLLRQREHTGRRKQRARDRQQQQIALAAQAAVLPTGDDIALSLRNGELICGVFSAFEPEAATISLASAHAARDPLLLYGSLSVSLHQVETLRVNLER